MQRILATPMHHLVCAASALGVQSPPQPLMRVLCCRACASQVYEGVAAMHSREFPRAAELLLDSIATFTT